MQTDAKATPTFAQSALRFLQPFRADREKRFGIARVKAQDGGCQFSKIRIIATVDQSGSMSDHCPDGKTKMQHVHHTIRNIAHYVVEEMPDISVAMSIIGFDDRVTVIEKETPITKELIDRMDDVLDKLRPRGMTNIHGALVKAKEIAEEGDTGPTVQTIQILLTDGQITAGPSDLDSLKDACSDVATNAFIGYGTDHSSYILKGLSEVPRGSYYFVESLENAGMAYGEILYQSIYELFRDVVIETTDCEVYDYKTNSWTRKLNVEPLAANQERTWHVRHAMEAGDYDGTPTPVVSIKLIRTGDAQKRIVNAVLPPAQYPKAGEKDLEVEKYWWRQKTQELMAEVKASRKEKTQNDTWGHPALRIPKPAWGHMPDLSTLPAPPKLKRHTNAPIGSSTATTSVEDEHRVLDFAKDGEWGSVLSMIIGNPALINCFPEPRRYTLLHHAIDQGHEPMVQKLIGMGADVDQKTRDGLTCSQVLAIKKNRVQDPEISDKIRSHLEKNTEESLEKKLTTFLEKMKAYMTEKSLLDDKFMQTLCDDIYVSIRSLTSTLGDMYLGARVSSQGVQRAYNVRDVSALEQSQRTPPPAGGRMSPLARPALVHEMSQDPTTPYAEPAVGAMMRAVSAPMKRTLPSPDAEEESK